MQAFEQLEMAFAEYMELKPENMVVCSSGTAALHLGIEALQLPFNATIVVPNYTMVACARAVVLAGHRPTFAEPNDNLVVDATTIEQSIQSSYNYYGSIPRALMAVHVYGRRCDMEPITKRFGKSRFNSEMYVIEDLAEAHGIIPHEDTDVACWSFYQNKIIFGEEGGAVYFKDKEKADLARRLRCLGFNAINDYRHIPRGHNYRLSNTHARLILDSFINKKFLPYEGLSSISQWDRENALYSPLDKNLDTRFGLWCEANDNLPIEWKIVEMPEAIWVCDIRIPEMTISIQDALVKYIRSRCKIQIRHGFCPMTNQQEFTQYRTEEQRNKWMGEQNLASEIIYIPIRPNGMDSADMVEVIDCIKQFIKTNHPNLAPIEQSRNEPEYDDNGIDW